MRSGKVFVILVLSFFMAACSPKQQATSELKVGTISGPETQLMQVAKEVAQKNYGLQVKIVEFTNYNSPNQALVDGDVDVNMFQHQPYLTASVNAHHFNIVPIAKTFIYPMGIYSDKYSRLSDITSGTVAVPDDPTNEARALLLLQKANLITLKNGVGVLATPNDIVSNPKNLKIKELDAAVLPQVLPEVTMAVINSNYAIAAGLHPSVTHHNGSHKNAIYLEGNDSDYANLFVVRKTEQDDPKVKELVDAFQSPQVLTAAQEIFHGDAIKAW